MNQCRVCKEYGTSRQNLIKYSVRHYAHPKCALAKWGAAFFGRLTPWQAANQFPIMVAREFGVIKELEQRASTNPLEG